MLTINAIRQTARGTPIWQPGAINLHVSVPCPLKVRLKEALGAFITDYNQRHERPLFCPSILDGIPHGIDDLMQSSDNAQELPDIWVSTGLHTAFSQPFKGTKKDIHSHQMLKKPYSQFDQTSSSRNRFICSKSVPSIASWVGKTAGLCRRGRIRI